MYDKKNQNMSSNEPNKTTLKQSPTTKQHDQSSSSHHKMDELEDKLLCLGECHHKNKTCKLPKKFEKELGHFENGKCVLQ